MKYIMIVFTFCITVFPCFSQALSKGKWSVNLGNMNCQDAKNKCEAMKMRLPALDELKDAFHDREMEKWKEDNGGNYWSATDAIDQNLGESMPDTAMFLSSDGYESRSLKANKEDYIVVRCIHKNFKKKERKSGIIWSEYQGEMDLNLAKKNALN